MPNAEIDLDNVNVVTNGIESTYNFTLNWVMPFANFDPIQNYTVTIGCDVSGCPLTETTDNVTTSLAISYATRTVNVTIMVTANNNVGASTPAVLEVAS